MNAIKFEVSKARRFARRAAIASVAVVSVAGASAANAADWAAMTAGLDFSGEETAIIAIVGVLFSFYVVRKGANLLLSMIR